MRNMQTHRMLEKVGATVFTLLLREAQPWQTIMMERPIFRSTQPSENFQVLQQ